MGALPYSSGLNAIFILGRQKTHIEQNTGRKEHLFYR